MKNIFLFAALLMFNSVLSQEAKTVSSPSLEKDDYVENISKTQRKVFGPSKFHVFRKNANSYYSLFYLDGADDKTKVIEVHELNNNFKETVVKSIPIKSDLEIGKILTTWETSSSIILLFKASDSKSQNESVVGWMINKTDLTILKENIVLLTGEVSKKTSYQYFTERSPANTILAIGSWHRYFEGKDAYFNIICINQEMKIEYKRGANLPYTEMNFGFYNAVVNDQGDIFLHGLARGKSRDPFIGQVIIIRRQELKFLNLGDERLSMGRIEIMSDNTVYYAGLLKEDGLSYISGLRLVEIKNNNIVELIRYNFPAPFIEEIDKIDGQAASSKNGKGISIFNEVVQILKRENGSIDVLLHYTGFAAYGQATFDRMRSGSYYRMGNIIDVNISKDQVVLSKIQRLYATMEEEVFINDAFRMSFYMAKVDKNDLYLLYPDFNSNINQNNIKSLKREFEEQAQITIAKIDTKGLVTKKLLFKLTAEKQFVLRKDLYHKVNNNEIVFTPYFLTLGKKMFFKYVSVTY